MSHPSRTRASCTAAALWLALQPAQAGEVIANGGNTVEFLGLERTKATAIHSALGGTPGQAVHYCAADLLAKTDLADAAVTVHFGPGGAQYCVVTALERPRPATAALRAAPPADLDAARFEPLARALDADESVRNAVHLFGAARRSLEPAALAELMEETYGAAPPVAEAFAALDLLRGESDAALAAAVATSAGEASLRRAAIAALANFADRDAAWRALVVACVDDQEALRDDARTALFGFLRAGPRPIDWSPARAELAALFAGANPWALPVMFETLARTELDPSLARELLAAEPALAVAYATAEHAPTRAHARALLVGAAGADHGDDPAAWRAYFASLR